MGVPVKVKKNKPLGDAERGIQGFYDNGRICSQISDLSERGRVCVPQEESGECRRALQEHMM
jgi:hypothetical protein